MHRLTPRRCPVHNERWTWRSTDRQYRKLPRQVSPELRWFRQTNRGAAGDISLFCRPADDATSCIEAPVYRFSIAALYQCCGLSYLVLHAFLLAMAMLATGCTESPPRYAGTGYDVVLLAGQSNMSGRGLGADPMADTPADARLLAWDARANTLRLARDPLPHQDLGERPVRIGPGISFGHAYLARGGAGRQLVLVPAAYGGTGFTDKAGSWRVTGAAVSPLVTEAVARANAAMRAAHARGAPARFVAILWHQGETDGGTRMAPEAYAAELVALAGYLRSHIDGAGPSTPFIVGQYVPAFLAGSPSLQRIAGINRNLPATLARSACVGSAGLSGNGPSDTIHFDAASQRVLGGRYAAALDALERHDTSAPCDWRLEEPRTGHQVP